MAADHRRNVALLLGAAVLFSTGGTAIKASVLGPWPLAGFRAAIAAATVLVVMKDSRRGWTWPAAVVGVAYAATVILFVTANKLTTAANTIFLQDTSPLYIALLGPLLLHEKVTRRELAFMVTLAVGLGLILSGSAAPADTAPNPRVGNILATISAFTCALMMMGLRWLQRGGRRAGPSAVVIGNLIACAIALPLAFPVTARPLDWALLVWLGVFQIGIAYALMMSAMQHVGALEASLLMFVEPVLSPIWAWLVHGEHPGTRTLMGGAIILGATAVKTWTASPPPTVDEASGAIPHGGGPTTT